jgi:hypothetical protein
LNKNYQLLALIGIFCIVSLIFIHNPVFAEEQKLTSEKSSKYITLKIDETVNQKFYLNIQQSSELNQHRLDIIYNAFFSEEFISGDTSLMSDKSKCSKSIYYLGWAGAINSIVQDNKFTIPINLHPMIIDTNEVRIKIQLSDLPNPYGYSGYTKPFVADKNKISKVDITIYDIDSLSDAELATIVRHELGHALGLVHSDDAKDLMHSIIKTTSYISECNVDALVHLYDINTKIHPFRLF